MKENVEFLGLLLSIAIASGTILWKIAEAKADIYQRIDTVNDRMRDELAVVRNRLDIHLAQYNEHRGMNDYIVQGLTEKIDHKFNRLHGTQTNLQSFLQAKLGFIPRESYGSMPDSQA